MSEDPSGVYYPKQAYSDNIKKFAVTLFSYSKKAYEYVRDSLNGILPSISSIRRWLNKIDGSPGFNEQALNQLSFIVRQKEMLGTKVITQLQ